MGSAGLAIGLALRKILSKLAAGLILAFNGSFRQGNIIEVNPVIGMVVEIDLLTTDLKTPDAKQVVIPNGSLMQASVIKYSTFTSRRIEVIVGISPDDDIEEVEAVIRDSIVRQSFYLSIPEAIVGVD